MARKVRFELTPQGHAKLYKVYRKALEHSKKFLKEGSEKIVKVKIAQRAPNSFEEARLLCVGVITEPFVDRAGRSRGSGTRGSWDARRFMKIGKQEFLQVAIMKEPVKVEREMDLIKTNLGRTSFYSGPASEVSIGFSWHGGGMIRSTDDPEADERWRYLLQAWEFGGTFPDIRARKPGGALEPERGVLALAMTKTLTPFSMFGLGGLQSKPLMRIFIMRGIKEEIRSEFGR